MIRIDPDVEPGVFRGATLSRAELEHSSQHRERRSARPCPARRDRTTWCSKNSVLATDAQQIYVDCTAEGLPPVSPRPVFEIDRITPQYVTIGVLPLECGHHRSS